MEIKLVKSAFRFWVWQSAYDQYLEELNDWWNWNLVFVITKDWQKNWWVTDEHLIWNNDSLIPTFYFITVWKIINPDLKYLKENFKNMKNDFEKKHNIKLIIPFFIIDIAVFKINEIWKLEFDYFICIESSLNDDYVFYTKKNWKENTEKIYF